MAKVVSKPTVELKFTVELSEAEAGALDALFGYGIEAFLETFYAQMGQAYLKPYEAGLRSLASTCHFKSMLSRAEQARREFAE